MKKAAKSPAKKNRPIRRVAKPLAKPTKVVPAFFTYTQSRDLATSDPVARELADAVHSDDALQRLRRFVKKHTPPDQEYQDGFHRNRVRVAQVELMRHEYVNGNVKAGDKLLTVLKDQDS
jgi:hypothetical protein